ncbi:MAG: hypothetical protein QXP66_01015 [Candidatus Aenigmatarchaeota archaeon]
MENIILLIVFWLISSTIIILGSVYVSTVLAIILTKNENEQFKIFMYTAFIMITGLYLLLLTRLYWGIAPEYSTGERVGYITKLARKGLIWKTYEGEMQIGQGRQIAIQKPFEFCIDKNDDKLIDQIAQYQVKGKKIKVKYNQFWLNPITKCGSNYIITRAEIIE